MNPRLDVVMDMIYQWVYVVNKFNALDPLMTFMLTSMLYFKLLQLHTYMYIIVQCIHIK